MDNDEIYDLVVDGIRQALEEFAGGDDTAIARRMLGGRDLEDSDGRVFKKIGAAMS